MGYASYIVGITTLYNQYGVLDNVVNFFLANNNVVDGYVIPWAANSVPISTLGTKKGPVYLEINPQLKL